MRDTLLKNTLDLLKFAYNHKKKDILCITKRPVMSDLQFDWFGFSSSSSIT